MEVIHLLSIWLSGSEEESKALHKKLDEKIDSYAAGELEHAEEAISSIWDLARKKEPLPSIPKGQKEPYRSRPEASVRVPLVNSMRRGSLLHRKYWAKRSRGGSLGPIYFPSTIPSSTLSQVDACEWNCIIGDHGHIELYSVRVPRRS